LHAFLDPPFRRRAIPSMCFGPFLFFLLHSHSLHELYSHTRSRRPPRSSFPFPAAVSASVCFLLEPGTCCHRQLWLCFPASISWWKSPPGFLSLSAAGHFPPRFPIRIFPCPTVSLRSSFWNGTPYQLQLSNGSFFGPYAFPILKLFHPDFLLNFFRPMMTPKTPPHFFHLCPFLFVFFLRAFWVPSQGLGLTVLVF